jgi:hypothetical protein
VDKGRMNRSQLSRDTFLVKVKKNSAADRSYRECVNNNCSIFCCSVPTSDKLIKIIGFGNLMIAATNQ